LIIFTAAFTARVLMEIKITGHAELISNGRLIVFLTGLNNQNKKNAK